MKTISKNGDDGIKTHEACARKGNDGLIYPYLDACGLATIGWGNRYYDRGIEVTMKDSPITQEQADDLFLLILKKFVDGVNFLVKSDISQNQFDALVSFAYNVGLDLNHNGIAEGLGESTLLRKVNQNPSDPSIRSEFMKWTFGIVDGKFQSLPGLTSRRAREADLYFS